MNTVKDIKSLKIQGSNFIDETTLDLFDKSTVSLLYGENGAGKSSIAKGIYNYVNQISSPGINAALLDSNKDEIPSEDIAGHVFVFDDNYINRTLGMKSTTGLETIVILGELKDVEDEINKQKILLEEETSTWKQADNRLKELGSSQNTESAVFLKKRIFERLKEDRGWAERDGQIRDNKTKSRVKEKTIKNIISHQEFLKDLPKDIAHKGEEQREWIKNYIQENVKGFNNKLKLYQNISKNDSSISEKIDLVRDSFDEIAFSKMLMKTFEKPEITERDKLIASIAATLQEKGVEFINKAKTEFEREEVDKCPYCQRKLTPENKKELLEAINKVLEVQSQNQVSNQLSHFRIKKVPVIDWKKFKPLKNDDLIENCKNAVEALRGRIEYINKLVAQKLNNPYQSIDVDLDEIKYKDSYESALKNTIALNNAVDAYNDAVEKRDIMDKVLTALNDHIAFWEIYELYKDWKNAERIYTAQEKIVSAHNRKVNEISDKINKLNERKKQVKIAVDEINASLAYIFLSPDRLKIEYNNAENEYKIKVRGRDVKPEDVSKGERNAIALSYFFSDIKKEKEQKNFYQGEYLLVIDDPISSFDRENRIGVVSFLRKELLRFKKGNKNTKIVIMTHDLQVFFNLQKMFDSIPDKLKTNRKLDLNILVNNKFKKLNPQKYHEYSFLLQQIYCFAKEMPCGYLDLEIGNMLRRVMEAYGTFVYRTNGTYLFNNDKILNKIEDINQREFFRNFMMRLFLNADSHFEEAVQSFNDMNFFSTLSPEKKREYAKCVLCFLYILNPTHVLAHLKPVVDNGNTDEWKEENVKSQFSKWMKDIDKIAKDFQEI